MEETQIIHLTKIENGLDCYRSWDDLLSQGEKYSLNLNFIKR